jgi:hypothetical protein
VLKPGLLVIAIGFLVGCTTSKEDALIQSYQQKVDYHKQLQKTEKIQLFENNVTKAVLTATYLYRPNFEKIDTRDEEFIIGIHFEDEGVESIVEMMGMRDADDIQKLQAKKEKQSKHADNSLFADITKLIGLRNKHENDKAITVVDKKKNNDTNDTVDNNTSLAMYGLTLNKKKAIKITSLNSTDERLKHIAYVTEWGNYYLVTFEHTNSKRFSLVFNSEKYGKGTFSFAKVAKYIYTKKGF